MSRDELLAQQVIDRLRQLKMPGAAKCFQERARQASAEGLSFEEFLLDVLDEELRHRTTNAARERRREARFPLERTLDQFVFADQPGVSKDLVIRLSRCQWVEQAEPILLAGPVGTGKTHLAIALGIEATSRRFRVRFYRADDLVRELTEAKSEYEVGRLMKRLDRVDVLIVDELGFVPFDRVGAELLFNLLVQRYQRRATVVTTNLAFSDWVKVFGDERMTAALLDRLADRAHVLTTVGASYRTRGRLRQDETEVQPSAD